MNATDRLPIILIVSCALVGGYGGMFLSFHHGFFDALRICVSASLEDRGNCVLNVPDAAFIPSYTKVPAIDSRLAILFEFFAQGLTSRGGDDGLDYEAILAMGYLAAQFGGAWYLLALEGLRKSSSGTVLTRTGIFGIVFQVVTITIIAPIYLVIHIISAQAPDQNAIIVDLLDLKLLPTTFVMAYVLPTAGLLLPLLGIVSPAGKYLAIALWQPFPLYQSAIHEVLRSLLRGKSDRAANINAQNSSQYRKALGKAYTSILWLTMGIHILVVGIIAMSHWTRLPLQLSATEILAPSSLTRPPTLAVLSPPVSALSSQTIVASFLRWDVYCSCAALIVWSAYLVHRAQIGVSILGAIIQIVLWTVVGGPITPAVMLLWQRDVAILDRAQRSSAYVKRR
ncbi:hypothetical protein JX266_011340 [Neoarthrinium moseri]|nr:hypothetical protein JX266_011340 [Neoarthrinium moseri]